MSESLKKYRAKRDFNRTREPSGAFRARAPAGASPRFVVQKHQAGRLHFDFRLEMDGVLKSWAVPKGIPTAKDERRLAMEVEDHPMEYAAFEGIIPPGSYGAGTVQLWDRGRYQVLDGTPREALRRGKLSLALHGEKLSGRWTLVRMRGEGRDRNTWLLIKAEASLPKISVTKAARSVKSGKTMTQLSQSRSTWKSAPAKRGPASSSFKERIRHLAARKHK